MMLATRFRQVLSGICSTRKQQDTLPQDLRRYRIDVLGIQETRICTLDKKRIGDYTLLTLPAVQERHGIGFAISPRVRPYLHCYWAHCDRIGVVQLLLPHAGPVNIVTAYAPHSGRPLAEVDRFYADLSDTLDQLPRRNIAFVTGDFNAKLGQQINGEAFMGPHARGIRNRNGHALADFCSTHLLFATNTGFQKRARHKTTWIQRQTNHCIYNQIDYILCPQNCRRLYMDARSWGGTLTASDHKLVTADFILNAATHRLRYSAVKPDPALKLARDHLIYDDTARDDYTNALQAALSQPTAQGSTVLQRWTDTLDRIREAAEGTIGFAGPNHRHVRHHDDELQLLSEAQRALQLRIYNDCAANTIELRAARNKILHQIRARCRAIASRKLDERITRIENLSDSARMYAAVRDISPHRTQPLLNHDQEGKYILRQQTTNKVITDHFRTLFYDPGRLHPVPDREPRSLTRPVTATEVEAAFRRLNNERAAGPAELPAELLKYGASVLAPLFADLVNCSFEQGTPSHSVKEHSCACPSPTSPEVYVPVSAPSCC
ncbi:hypothetical protein PHYSODRAFT_336759 [Phytophthora sojae]|uniref:Endonuclease/exonuclease/phosphatase domain-containing protein n=1 Tax=Phytophthora sojae (strain P6497) TaxID=1094619 RepID=G4ZW43_PHYSP|nr:hypothetical protein PHYSODRAFT_336759 [Phytophthora sojae]EGZ12325.1 hypothetical protein PHYSODRAFT_336759 [Phytophthora sojae]|eukprot:XP_009532658.1 hypothetical protein PHYSODRAFT_336759 [Phytophthora sojae]